MSTFADENGLMKSNRQSRLNLTIERLFEDCSLNMALKQKLNSEQIEHFWEHGYVVANSGLDDVLLDQLDVQLDLWIESSRQHTSNFGTTVDGKARFDLEVGHSRETPKLRRVANPVDISERFQTVLWDGPIVDMVAQLIGPNVRYHHCKLNIKLPKMKTQVYYHQDHSYDPHTNDDMLAILLMLDDADELNGCLRVVPGSHKERYSHYRNGQYIGTIDPSYYQAFDSRAVPIVATRGDICFIHTWMVHGSEVNRSSQPRRLLICDYSTADAYPLLPPALPSKYSGKILRGQPSPTARLRNDVIEMRTPYTDDSFFELQGQFTT